MPDKPAQPTWCGHSLAAMEITPEGNELFTVTGRCPVCKVTWIFHGCSITETKSGYEFEIQRLADTPGITVESVTLVPEGKNRE